jgi:internalin A
MKKLSRNLQVRTNDIMVLVALFGLLGLSQSALAEDPVYFPDANLKASVEWALEITDPTPTDMLSLTALETWGEISDLTGIEYASNLIGLYLHSSQISDISPLSGLTSLQYLDLTDSQISDISPLSGLTGLETLYLYRNQISDLSPLSGLTSLTSLALGTNQISDLSPLSELTTLTSLGHRITRSAISQPYQDLRI